MAATIGAINVKIQTDTRPFQQGLQSANGALQAFARGLGAPLKAANALVSGLGKIGLAGLGIQTLAQSASGLANALGVGLNVELENVQAQLLAFTKDGDKAASILADIRQEAARTPFAFQEMAQATASLLPASQQSGAALMDLVKQAEILAALNPAEGLAGAAFALREALSGDFVSIVERFNLPRQRLNELKEQGVPALEAVRIAMQEMGADASLVSNLAATASGRWSTFMDTIDTLRATLAQPLFDFLSAGLVQVQELIDANLPRLQELARTAGQQLAEALQAAAVFLTDRLLPAIRDVGSQAGPIFERLQQAWDDLSPTGERLRRLFEALRDAVVSLVPTPLLDLVRGFLDTASSAAGGRDALGLLTDAINAVSRAVADAITFVRDHYAVQVALVGIVGALTTAWALQTAAVIAHTVATQGLTIATTALTAAQRVLNLVLAANPIGLVITVLAGLAAALIYAYQTSEEFRAVVDGAFAAVRDTALTVFTFVRDFLAQNWQEILSIALLILTGPGGLVAAFATNAFGIRDTLTAVFTEVQDFLGETLAGIQETWSSAWGAVSATFAETWAGIVATARDSINSIIGFLNRLIGAWNGLEFRVPSFDIDLPEVEIAGKKVGGGSLSFGGATIGFPDLPTIPALAHGGIVTEPMLALLGERGPEAVVPLGAGMGGLRLTREDARMIAEELARVIPSTVQVEDIAAGLTRFGRRGGRLVGVVP